MLRAGDLTDDGAQLMTIFPGAVELTRDGRTVRLQPRGRDVN